MKPSRILIAVALVTTVAPAAADPQKVRGSQFITMMQGNTVQNGTCRRRRHLPSLIPN